MTQLDDQSEKGSKVGNERTSRRSVLFGSGSLLVGGIAGRVSVAEAAPQQSAPPLPWAWPGLDPMEAGTRAYQTYLTQKG